MKTKQNLIQFCLAVALLMQVFVCGAQPVVTNIAAGLYHSLFITSDGSLWGMGENGFGQLGIGNFINTNLPVKIVTNDVVAIAGGGFHTLFVKRNGSLWAMGDDQYGELGDGTLNTTNLPEMILPSGVTAVAAGVYHSLFLKADGTLWGMGYNHDGQLGDGSFGSSNQTNRPEFIDSNVVAIACGNYHSLYQKTDSSLWGMGYNGQGALGTGNYNSVYKPFEITNSALGFAAGGNHSLFFSSDVGDPNLWSIGDNSHGEFGNGNFNNSAVPELNTNIIVDFFSIIKQGDVIAGSDHTLFLDGDNEELNGMGRNDYGQLGNGTYDSTTVPVQSGIGYIRKMTAGAYHSMCLRYDGGLWLMGNNGGGELGDGTLNNVNIPNLIVPGNLVVNGGFETGDFSGWTLTVPGYRDTVVSAIRPPDGAQYSHSGMFAAQFSDIYLGGLGGSTESVIAQNLSTQPGTSYLISFWAAAITNSSLIVSWNGNPVLNLSVPVDAIYGASNFTNFQAVVKATETNSILQFQFPSIFNHHTATTALDDVSVVPLPPNYNQINAQLANGGMVRLTYLALAPVISDIDPYKVHFYALDRTFNLATPNWVPQATNYLDDLGGLVFINMPDATTNNFWRIRYVGTGYSY
jgi:alpha-tubulin suppressor-like RCC1 family protein